MTPQSNIVREVERILAAGKRAERERLRRAERRLQVYRELQASARKVAAS